MRVTQGFLSAKRKVEASVFSSATIDGCRYFPSFLHGSTQENCPKGSALVFGLGFSIDSVKKDLDLYFSEHMVSAAISPQLGGPQRLVGLG